MGILKTLRATPEFWGQNYRSNGGNLFTIRLYTIELHLLATGLGVIAHTPSTHYPRLEVADCLVHLGVRVALCRGHANATFQFVSEARTITKICRF